MNTAWKKIATGYFLLQCTTTAFWWLVLLMVPSSRSLFTFQQAPDNVLLGFWLADMLYLIFGSLMAAWAMWNQPTWTLPILLLLSGGVGYAALYCLGLSLLTGEAWLATL